MLMVKQASTYRYLTVASDELGGFCYCSSATPVVGVVEVRNERCYNSVFGGLRDEDEQHLCHIMLEAGSSRDNGGLVQPTGVA